MEVFESRTATGSRIFSSLRYYQHVVHSIKLEIYAKTRASQLIQGGENTSKTLKVAFRLPSVAQKRLCLRLTSNGLNVSIFRL